MKVRIKETPREPELDGVRLDILQAGTVREVSPSIGSWLVAQGYAEPEMRRSVRPVGHEDLSPFSDHRSKRRERD